MYLYNQKYLSYLQHSTSRPLVRLTCSVMWEHQNFYLHWREKLATLKTNTFNFFLCAVLFHIFQPPPHGGCISLALFNSCIQLAEVNLRFIPIRFCPIIPALVLEFLHLLFGVAGRGFLVQRAVLEESPFLCAPLPVFRVSEALFVPLLNNP